jgi:hypothetical protein
MTANDRHENASRAPSLSQGLPGSSLCLGLSIRARRGLLSESPLGPPAPLGHREVLGLIQPDGEGSANLLEVGLLQRNDRPRAPGETG